jgi:hypothetical protein
MTRHRLTLVIVAAVLCGGAWWLSLDRLSAEERLLVGTWTFDGESGTGRSCIYFSPDRQSTYGWLRISGSVPMVGWGGRWYIQSGALVFDSEPSVVRRAVRPFARGVGLPVNGALTYRLESINADYMVLVMSDGTRETWTRAPAE